MVIWMDEFGARALAAAELEFATKGVYGLTRKSLVERSGIDPQQLSYHLRGLGKTFPLAVLNLWINTRCPIINDARAAIIDWVSVEEGVTLYTVASTKQVVFDANAGSQLPLAKLLFIWFYPYVWYLDNVRDKSGLARVFAAMLLHRPEVNPLLEQAPWRATEVFAADSMTLAANGDAARVQDLRLLAINILAEAEWEAAAGFSATATMTRIADRCSAIFQSEGLAIPERWCDGVGAVIAGLKLDTKLQSHFARSPSH